MTVFTLSAPDLDDLTLSRTDGWAVRKFDWVPGPPRSITYQPPQRSGMVNRTQFADDGTVTFALRLVPGFGAFQSRIDRLQAFTEPDVRPTLTVDYEDGSLPRRAVLADGVVTSPMERPTHRDAVAQWSAPDGIFESVAQQQVIIRAAPSDSSVIGLSFPVVFPLAWPAAPVVGAGLVTNIGNTIAYPILRLRGPMSDRIEIIHVDLDRSIVLDGFTIPAGSYVDIDTRTKRILANSDPAESRRQFLVYPDTSWWALSRGAQRVRLVVETFDSPAQVEVLWHHAYR